MNYKEVLQLLHQIIDPDKYVEIGVAEGRSLKLAKCRSIAIDPSPRITHEIEKNKTLYEITSDAFFAKYDLTKLLDGHFDLAFIDGMDLVEDALRNFMNLEKHSHMASCIVIDDILPGDIDWTTREKKRKEWTGDIYRLFYILKDYRPDLDIEIFKLDISGIAIISNLNKESSHLEENYDEITENINAGKYIVEDVETLVKDFQPTPIDKLDQWVQAKENDLDKRNYLDLLKSCLINEIYADNDLRIIYLQQCRQWKRKFRFKEFHDIIHELPDEYQKLMEAKNQGRHFDRDLKKAGFAHSMIGSKRMNSLISCLDTIRKNGIDGDLIECGVWRGGAAIMMAAYNKTYKLHKKIFLADSFEGLPKPSYRQDKNLNLSKKKYPELAVSLDVVKENFKKYNLLSHRIVFLEGWFNQTLPELDADMKISLLRMDGDLYESTMNILDNLYDKVVPGGIIIVDDFGISNCKKAVIDFLDKRNLEEPDFQKIDWTGVFWTKESD